MSIKGYELGFSWWGSGSNSGAFFCVLLVHFEALLTSREPENHLFVLMLFYVILHGDPWGICVLVAKLPQPPRHQGTKAQSITKGSSLRFDYFYIELIFIGRLPAGLKCAALFLYVPPLHTPPKLYLVRI